MAKKIHPKKVHHPVRAVRPGEIAVAVSRKVIPHPDGTSRVEIGIDLSQVPIPERRYAADVAGVIYDGEVTQIKILFGQKKLVGSDLRSLIAITMSPDALHRFLASCEALIPENNGFMDAHGIDPVPLVQLSEEPEQTVAMAANIVALARSGREATADFYHVSAAAFHALSKHDAPLGIDPIVRVDVPLGILGSLLDALVALSTQIPQELR